MAILTIIRKIFFNTVLIRLQEISGAQSCRGRLFHIPGPASANRRSPWPLCARRGTQSCPGVSWAQRAHANRWSEVTLVGQVGQVGRYSGVWTDWTAYGVNKLSSGVIRERAPVNTDRSVAVSTVTYGCVSYRELDMAASNTDNCHLVRGHHNDDGIVSAYGVVSNRIISKTVHSQRNKLVQHLILTLQWRHDMEWLSGDLKVVGLNVRFSSPSSSMLNVGQPIEPFGELRAPRMIDPRAPSVWTIYRRRR